MLRGYKSTWNLCTKRVFIPTNVILFCFLVSCFTFLDSFERLRSFIKFENNTRTFLKITKNTSDHSDVKTLSKLRASNQTLVNDKAYRYIATSTIIRSEKNFNIKSNISRAKGEFFLENCTSMPSAIFDRVFQVPEVNCDKLFHGDKNEIKFAVNLIKSMNNNMTSDKMYMNLTQNCDEFKTNRGYITCPVSSEEENFPIAFSLLVYKDIEMVERLLRAIYRPQNYYCIHVDRKSDPKFYNATLAIAQCFDNVFLTSKRISVVWGKFSVLEPEILCMEQLWKYKKWKYFINLTGQEFPLKTNGELIQILQAYNGANDIDGTMHNVFKFRWGSTPPPHNLTLVKGAVHIVCNRHFVDYILNNQTAKDFLEWTKPTFIPDETFFSTLNYNPQLGIKGTYNGLPGVERQEINTKPFLTRFKNWKDTGYPCASGRYVRDICVLTTGDLPLLGDVKHMFANKFFLQDDRLVIGCLEEMIFNRTRDEIMGYGYFNATYYSQLGFVLSQVTR